MMATWGNLMVLRFLKIAGSAVLPIALLPLAASAGGCAGHAECYAKVQSPDVYETVARPVVVAPARTEYVHSPAVVGYRPEATVVRPGHVSVHHTPAVYGTIARQVEVAPARAYYSHTPAVYGTQHRDVVVQPGGWRWERKIDRHGRETMCKVAVPAVTRTIAERVLVSPGHRQLHVTPAVTRDVHRTVVVREAEAHKVYHPAIYGWAHRAIVVKPATTHAVTHPAVVQWQHRNVLVQRGGTHWQPVGHHRHW